jgi:hypothetical protein
MSNSIHGTCPEETIIGTECRLEDARSWTQGERELTELDTGFLLGSRRTCISHHCLHGPVRWALNSSAGYFRNHSDVSVVLWDKYFPLGSSYWLKKPSPTRLLVLGRFCLSHRTFQWNRGKNHRDPRQSPEGGQCGHFHHPRSPVGVSDSGCGHLYGQKQMSPQKLHRYSGDLGCKHFIFFVLAWALCFLGLPSFFEMLLLSEI